MKKKLLYLRTDIIDKELIAGGSVTHTTGVIQGFIAQNYEITCASSVMLKILKTLPLKQLHPLTNPSCFKFLRWKINCVLSNIFFTSKVLSILKKNKFDFIYQRYSFLNFSGVLASKITKIPLIL